MNEQELLQEARRKDAKLICYEEELQMLMQRAYNISSPQFGEKVQSNKILSLENIVEEIEHQIEIVTEKWKEIAPIKEKARDIIDREKDETRFTILYSYYITLKNWDEIAKQIGKSRRQTERLHGKALLDIKNSKMS